MRLLFYSVITFCSCFVGIAQNDIDALRYSSLSLQGTSRSKAMGGAFGAIGADLSCTSTNPGGLGLYRLGELCFSGGLRLSSNTASLNKVNNNVRDINAVFNNAGIAISWPSKKDKLLRNAFSFTNNQLQNFNSKISMLDNNANYSLAQDMVNIGNTKAASSVALNTSYEGLGYGNYLLDYDPASKKYISLIDYKRQHFLQRNLETSGRVNELNFSLAQSNNDKYYYGISLGIPRVQYKSTLTHIEQNTNDSMKLNFTRLGPGNFSLSPNYLTPIPSLDTAYSILGNFKSVNYTEFFSTTGYGLNLKLGVVVRVNDYFRLGAYFHSPTLYSLADTYYNQIDISFKNASSSYVTKAKSPKDGGYFKYAIVTPIRFGFNTATIINKFCAIGVDYELTNYATAVLQSTNTADFAGVNAVIKNKYKAGHTIKVGAEFNVKPVMIRMGYNMQGSPFGDVFTGNLVKNTFSLGLGFRNSNGLFVDFVWYKTIGTENYFLFNSLDTKAQLNNNAAVVAITIGKKFKQ
jgi:hypothetical protein